MLTRLTQKLKIVLHQMISLPNQPTKEEDNKNYINGKEMNGLNLQKEITSRHKRFGFHFSLMLYNKSLTNTVSK